MKYQNDHFEHYQWLDLARFSAALIVVLAHVRDFLFSDFGMLDEASRGPLVMAFYAVTRLGHEAVIVFFVLSGYLVGGKAVDRIVNGIFQPTDYLVDRISRIWTPLLPALVLSAFVGGGDDGVVVWIGNMVALQNVTVPVLGGNGPLWSLTYEVWF